MNEKELRIGNFVSYLGETTVVNSVSFGTETLLGYVSTFKSGVMTIYSFQPIPLTEERLLKFGFERRPWGLIINGLLFRDNIKNPCEVLTLEIGNGFRTEVKYVHQLQNLYFALTGEELVFSNEIIKE